MVRREFVEKSKSTLPPEDIKQMLQQISTYDSASRVWEFRFPTDNDFLATYVTIMMMKMMMMKMMMMMMMMMMRV